jgi:hypothetical protein
MHTTTVAPRGRELGELRFLGPLTLSGIDAHPEQHRICRGASERQQLKVDQNVPAKIGQSTITIHISTTTPKCANHTIGTRLRGFRR